MFTSTYVSLSEAASQAGTQLERWLQEFSGDPLLLLLSGGSALEMLEYTNPSTLSKVLGVGVIDERWSPDVAANNGAKARETRFCQRAIQAGAIWLDSGFRAEESLEDMAKRMEYSWRTFLDAHPTARIIITLGIGVDGHTAGILPPLLDSAEFEEGLVRGYSASASNNKYPQRVTATLSLLRRADRALIYAVGAAKEPAVRCSLDPATRLVDCPAAIIQQLPEVVLITDCLK